MKQLIKYILFSMTICFCQFTLFAQQNKIDSLLTKIKTNKTDTNQLIQLNNISKEFESIGSYDSSIKYANSALQLGYLILKKYTDNIHKISVEKNTAISYNTIGLVNKNTGNYPEALKKYYSALKISEGIRDKKGIAESYYNIGILNWVQGNYDEELKRSFEDLHVRKIVVTRNKNFQVKNGYEII
jgi:tetratricopeptide (TPR) repeat protein